MKLPNNKVNIIKDESCFRLRIEMVHPKWIVNLLFGLLILIVLTFPFLIFYFDILELLGAGSLVLTIIWFFTLWGVGKIAFWHKYGREEYILSERSFFYQRSYGIYTEKLTSIEDTAYDIGFICSSSSYKGEEKGVLLFYTNNPITEVEEYIYESALEITAEEYNTIHGYLLLFREYWDITK